MRPKLSASCSSGFHSTEVPSLFVVEANMLAVMNIKANMLAVMNINANMLAVMNINEVNYD